MKPAKGRKKSVHVRHFKARAIVAHEVDLFTLFVECAELDACGRDLLGKLPGIRKKLFKGQPGQLGVYFRYQSRLNLEVGLSLLIATLKLLQDTFRHKTEVYQLWK